MALDCVDVEHVVTDKESYESLSTNVKMISEANCLLNGAKVECVRNGDFLTWASAGFAILGNNANVGELELKFSGRIGITRVEMEYTREDQWDQTCNVELLKNGNIIDRVPDNQGDSKNDRRKSITAVRSGDVLTLREGGDGSICGVHIYGLKVSCDGTHKILQLH